MRRTRPAEIPVGPVFKWEQDVYLFVFGTPSGPGTGSGAVPTVLIGGLSVHGTETRSETTVDLTQGCPFFWRETEGTEGSGTVYGLWPEIEDRKYLLIGTLLTVGGVSGTVGRFFTSSRTGRPRVTSGETVPRPVRPLVHGYTEGTGHGTKWEGPFTFLKVYVLQSLVPSEQTLPERCTKGVRLSLSESPVLLELVVDRGLEVDTDFSGDVLKFLVRGACQPEGGRLSGVLKGGTK